MDVIVIGSIIAAVTVLYGAPHVIPGPSADVRGALANGGLPPNADRSEWRQLLTRTLRNAKIGQWIALPLGVAVALAFVTRIALDGVSWSPKLWLTLAVAVWMLGSGGVHLVNARKTRALLRTL